MTYPEKITSSGQAGADWAALTNRNASPTDTAVDQPSTHQNPGAVSGDHRYSPISPIQAHTALFPLRRQNLQIPLATHAHSW